MDEDATQDSDGETLPLPKRLRKLVSLYVPIAIGFGVMGMAILNTFALSSFDSNMLLVGVGAIFSVFSLHRVHEYKNGFSEWNQPLWPSFAYACSLTIMMAALRYESPLVAAAGGIILVSTAYIRAS